MALTLTLTLTLTLAPALGGSAAAQDAPRGIPRFAIEDGPLTLHGPVRAGAYVAGLGRRAALLGDESGAFEVWVWPVKLVRDVRLAFRIPGGDAPIPGERVATSVTVRPEALTLTYSHAAFTVRQHVVVPLDEPGALVLLEVETVRPLEVLVEMHADLGPVWRDARGGARIAWLADRRRFLLSYGGAERYGGMIGSPSAVSGVAQPARGAPAAPSRFVLRFDAGRAAETFVPIAIAGGAAPRDSIAAVYDRLLGGAQRFYAEKLAHYRRVRRDLLAIGTPDDRLGLAFEWAKVDLDQQLVCNPELGCGLVAGFDRAGPGSFRPGLGWYFGGDAAVASLGMDGAGEFDLARRGLVFLARHQRRDGEIPHEVPHAAGRPPRFAGAPDAWSGGDTTPLWLLACHEHWNATGDEAFLHEVWPGIVRAYRWAAAMDGDGLPERPPAGTGAAVRGATGAAVHPDARIAALWVAALEGVRELGRAMGDTALAREADALLEKAGLSLEDGLRLEPAGTRAPALPRDERRAAGSAKAAGGIRADHALTASPGAALAFRLLDGRRASRTLREIGSAAITADWGTRPLSRRHPLYEPLHHERGAVDPVATGFAALASYRHHRAWAGFDLVRDLARTTFDFARGRHPALLSGEFYQALDDAVPHRFAAASMLVVPLVRGMLGLEADAPNHAVAIEPHLPAHWDSLSADNFRVGRDRISLAIRRDGEVYAIGVRRERDEGAEAPPPPLAARIAPALPLGARIARVTVNGRDAAVHVDDSEHDVHPVVEFELEDEALVEIEYRGGVEIVPPAERLRLGQPSEGLRILDFRRDGPDYLLLLEGPGGRSHALELRSEQSVRAVRGATFEGRDGDRTTLRVAFPPGEDYARREVRFRAS